jgi:hypothetical protein
LHATINVTLESEYDSEDELAKNMGGTGLISLASLFFGSKNSNNCNSKRIHSHHKRKV